MSFEELFDSGKGNLHLCYTWVVDNLEEINKNTIEYGKNHLKKLFINNNNVNVDDLKFEILLKECDYGKMPAENRVYLKCVNSSGEEAFIYLVSTYNPFEYVIKTKNYIKTIDVIFPLGVKEKIRKVNNSNGQYDFCIKDVITKKEGIYNAKNRKYVIEEQYDSLCENKTGFEAFLNGYKGLVNPYNKSYNIPIKYKNLNYYNKSCACDYCNYHNYNKNFNSIVFTERENHIGCYCYMLDYKKKNINYKGWYDFKYIKKRYIPNLFDKIEIYNIDDKRKNIFLKVWLNNKCGILDVYNKKFLSSRLKCCCDD